MFGEELKHITLSEEEFPIRCDLLVLEKIQDEYDDIWEFERKVVFWENRKANGKTEKYFKMPNLKAVNFGLLTMINEGIAVENEIKQEKRPFVTREEILRKADITPYQAARIVHGEFYDSLETKTN